MKWGDQEKTLAIHTGASLMLLGIPMAIFQWPLGLVEFFFLIPLQALFNRHGWVLFIKGTFLTVIFGSGLFIFLGQSLELFKDFPVLSILRAEDLIVKCLCIVLINAPFTAKVRNLYKILIFSILAVLIKIILLLYPIILTGWQSEVAKIFKIGIESLSGSVTQVPGIETKIDANELANIFTKITASCIWTLEFLLLSLIVRVGRVWATQQGEVRLYFKDFSLNDKFVWVLLGSLVWIILSWLFQKNGINFSKDIWALALNNISGVVLLIYSFKGIAWLQDYAYQFNWGPGLRVLLNVTKFLLMAWTIMFCLLRGLDLSESWPALILPIIGSLGIWIKIKDLRKERG